MCDQNMTPALRRDRLTGALIGLARATEGNEHMLSQSTAAVVMEGLRATEHDGDFSQDAFLTLTEKVKAEKQKLVPDCFYCACPCGRTSDYCLDQLQDAAEEIRNLKFQLLSHIRSIASATDPAEQYDNSIPLFLYQALIVIGIEEFPAEDLLPILQKAAALQRK